VRWRARLGQIKVHVLDRNQLRAVRLDDDDVLEADAAGVLDRLIPSDDGAVLIKQNRAPAPKLRRKFSIIYWPRSRTCLRCANRA
jgi:hypothetical protein